MKQLIKLILLLSLCACKTEKINTTSKVSFDYEGHRGCRGLMPENTIPAMMKALELKVSTLEMDLHITKDSQVVLSHDPWFNPDITTMPDGSYIEPDDHSYIIYNMTYDSIKKFDVGMKPYDKFPQQKKIPVAKPLLQNLIDSVKHFCLLHQQNIFYNMEIKSFAKGDDIYHPEPEKYVDIVMAVLQKNKVEKDVIIQSFDMRPLQYLHTKYPDMKTSMLIEDTDKRSIDELTKALGFVPAILSPAFTLVTKGLVDSCHKKNVKVIPWTINKVADMKRLKALHVDGLISDYPNLYNNNNR